MGLFKSCTFLIYNLKALFLPLNKKYLLLLILLFNIFSNKLFKYEFLIELRISFNGLKTSCLFIYLF
jgi:hypothetical protein